MKIISYIKTSKWASGALQLVGFVLLFAVLSAWMGRHMLDRGEQVSSVSLPSLEGQVVNLHWPSEHKHTLVYFFAPWCSVCRISMPGLNLFIDPDKSSSINDLNIVAIALDYENTQEVQEYILNSGFNGQVLLGNQQQAKEFNISGYPSYYVLDQQGQILHSDRGITTPVGVWLRTQIK